MPTPSGPRRPLACLLVLAAFGGFLSASCGGLDATGAPRSDGPVVASAAWAGHQGEGPRAGTRQATLSFVRRDDGRPLANLIVHDVRTRMLCCCSEGPGIPTWDPHPAANWVVVEGIRLGRAGRWKLVVDLEADDVGRHTVELPIDDG